jgi:hypothetical protein
MKLDYKKRKIQEKYLETIRNKSDYESKFINIIVIIICIILFICVILNAIIDWF